MNLLFFILPMMRGFVCSPNPDFVIRHALATEAEMLAVIHQECFPNYWNNEAFTNFFSIDGTIALVAETPEVVGMMVYRILFDQAEIITLAVRPSWRRQAIAQTLLQYAMKEALTNGVEKIFLDVEEGNDAAICLYKKYGFTEIKRRKWYYRQKDGSFTDALVMMGKIA